MPNNSPFCESCEMRTDDFRHLKNCVEPKNWPTGPYRSHATNQNALKGLPNGLEPVLVTEVVLTSTSTENASEIALQSVCECGYVVKAGNVNPAGALRLHKLKSKAHRIAV